MRAAFGLAMLGMISLGGCGQPDAQIRNELIAQMMNRCERQIAPNTADLPGFDSDAYCRCVTDKAFGDRSLAEVQALFDESRREEMIAKGRVAGTECLAAQREAADKAVPAPTAGEGNAVSTAPTPAPAPAAERERPREREKAEPVEPRRPRLEETRETPQPRSEPVAPRPRPAPEPAIDDEEEEPSDAA